MIEKTEALVLLLVFWLVFIPLICIVLYLALRTMDNKRYGRFKVELQVKWPKYWHCVKCSFVAEAKIGTVCERCGISDWKALSDYEIGVYESDLNESTMFF